MVVAQSTEEQREPGGEDCFQSTQSRTAMRLIASTLHQLPWLTFGFLFTRAGLPNELIAYIFTFVFHSHSDIANVHYTCRQVRTNPLLPRRPCH